MCLLPHVCPLAKLLTNQMISRMKPSHAHEHHLPLISKPKTIDPSTSVQTHIVFFVLSLEDSWPAFSSLRNIRTFSNMRRDDIYCGWISCRLLMCKGWRKLKQTALIVQLRATVQQEERKGRNILSASPCLHVILIALPFGVSEWIIDAQGREESLSQEEEEVCGCVLFAIWWRHVISIHLTTCITPWL